MNTTWCWVMGAALTMVVAGGCGGEWSLDDKRKTIAQAGPTAAEDVPRHCGEVDPIPGEVFAIRRDGRGAFHMLSRTQGSGWISYQTDASGQWKRQQILGGGNADLVLDAQGNPHVLHVNTSRVRYGRRIDGEFILEEIVSGNDDLYLGGKLALDHQGRPHVSVTNRQQLEYFRRSNGGWTKEIVGQLANTTPEPRLLVDDAGEVDLFYLRRQSYFVLDLMHAHRSAAGEWHNERLASNLSAVAISAQRDVDGTFHLSYAVKPDGEPRAIYTRLVGDQRTDQPAPLPYYHTDLALDASGAVYLTSASGLEAAYLLTNRSGAFQRHRLDIPREGYWYQPLRLFVDDHGADAIFRDYQGFKRSRVCF